MCFTQNSSDTTKSTLTFVIALSYKLITDFTITSGTPFFRVTTLPTSSELYPKPSPGLRKHMHTFQSFSRYSFSSLFRINKASADPFSGIKSNCVSFKFTYRSYSFLQHSFHNFMSCSSSFTS